MNWMQNMKKTPALIALMLLLTACNPLQRQHLTPKIATGDIPKVCKSKWMTLAPLASFASKHDTAATVASGKAVNFWANHYNAGRTSYCSAGVPAN